MSSQLRVAKRVSGRELVKSGTKKLEMKNGGNDGNEEYACLYVWMLSGGIKFYASRY